jgi:hypothetical protein
MYIKYIFDVILLTVAGDEGDDDGGTGGRALNEDREEDGDHQAHDRVGQQGAVLENRS